MQWFVAVAAVVVIGAAVIATLLLERRHRRITARLAQRLRFETLLAEISRLLGPRSDESAPRP